MPRFCRLTLEVRGPLLSRVGDLMDSPGVFGRRMADAGIVGGPITIEALFTLSVSRVGDATRLLALAITSLWSGGRGGCTVALPGL